MVPVSGRRHPSERLRPPRSETRGPTGGCRLVARLRSRRRPTSNLCQTNRVRLGGLATRLGVRNPLETELGQRSPARPAPSRTTASNSSPEGRRSKSCPRHQREGPESQGIPGFYRSPPTGLHATEDCPYQTGVKRGERRQPPTRCRCHTPHVGYLLAELKLSSMATWRS